MFTKATVAVGAALALSAAFIATDAFAAHAGGHAGGQRVGHAGAHYGHRYVGYRGGYGPGYGYYNPGYGYSGYGYYGRGPCLLPLPLPVVGCW